MNLGLGNLITLKRALLATDLVARTTWDEKITALGQGVARLLERHCNRRFERTDGAVDQFTADRRSWTLQRFPVESIASVEQRDTVSGGWTSLGAVDSILIGWDAGSGIVHFGAVLGPYTSLLRITYTGGLWFDTTEDDTGVMPADATLLIEDIKLAWLLQCQKAWQVMDPLGTGMTKGGGDVALVGLSLAGLEVIPQVKQLLAPHVRYQIT
jgi:hypothetical protein